MRVLTTVWTALFALALGSPAALAQSDSREPYGPITASPTKPKTAKPSAAKPNPAQPNPPNAAPQATAAKPRGPAPAAAVAKKETAAPTDGRAAKEKPSNKKDAKKDAKDSRQKKVASTDKSGADAALKPPAIRDAYMALPHAERLALQFNLTWTGDYRGLADGEFSDKLVEAMKDYQKRNKLKVTGLLSPEERTALAAAVTPRQSEAGWRVIEDPATGARIGIPSKFATRITTGPAGTRWSSEQGQLQIETFRVDTGATLEAVYEQQKGIPRRRLTANNLGPDSFMLAGMQGLKKMRVYGYARNGEVRGLTILYDQAMEGTMDPLVAPIAWAYLPFPQGFSLAAATEAPRRKVEYGTGIFVAAEGAMAHVLTDRRLIEGCQVITLPGLGHAERVAEDRLAGLVLLRINGASNISVAPLAADNAAGAITLVGVADPAAQAGGGAVSSVKSRVSAAGSVRTLEPSPAPGFAGAAAFDTAGRLAGMAQLPPMMTSGTAAAAPQASIVAADAIRRFLQESGATQGEQAKLADNHSAVTRVICVRK
ncbi:MAG: peptidoglycan-binding protein [Xanthobacteraceae bacterium]|nr:peptidoglycan-binding protein [Xanthobacteraceae bacterium]